MKKLNAGIVNFFQGQSFVIISTIGKDGFPHNSCKGIVKIDKEGRVYLLDLYQARTYENLKNNTKISITAVEEHQFKGYCLKGRARIIPSDTLTPQIKKAWEEKITMRIAKRLIKNLRSEQGLTRHSEALLPRPKYMIMLEVEDIVDLASPRLR